MRFGHGISGVLGFAILAVSWPSAVLAQYRPLTKSEQSVCKGLDECRDILLRHGPEDFDYWELATRYRAFGPKGKAQLIKLISSKRDTAIRHAQYLLGQPGWRFTPAEQTQIAALWPVGDIDAHAKIMITVRSPMMRNTAIATLSDDDPRVRKASRAVLQELSDLEFPLPRNAVMQLSRAAIDYPTPDIIEHISALPKPQSRPVLERVMLSGDAGSVIAAYDALYVDDPKRAFAALMQSLDKLQTPEQSFALGEMLAHRNNSREDGFYLKFAKDLAEDEMQKPLARLAGLHAVMVQASGTAHVKLDQSKTLVPLTLALSNHAKAPDFYLNGLKDYTGELSEDWIAAFDASYLNAKSRVGAKRYAKFITQLATQNTPQTHMIVSAAIDDKTDYTVQIAGIFVGATYGMDVEQRLKDFRETHPITKVRLAADMALSALADDVPINPEEFMAVTRSWPKNHTKLELQRLNKNAIYCAIKSTDLQRSADEMPFFPELNTGQHDFSRQSLSSAEPLKTGWLAGYDKGEWGSGLVYYDYKKKAPQNLLSENVIAILPVANVPTGQYASAYWVVTGLNHMTSDYGHIYRVTQTDDSFDVRFHAKLPRRPESIRQETDDVILFNFRQDEWVKKYPKFDKINNPPLVLMPTGAIARACQDASVSTPAKALP